MRELRTYGSARGAPSNGRPYRHRALGRKNHLFAGSDGGGVWWAIVCSLIETAKLNDIEPYGLPGQALGRARKARYLPGL